MLLSINSLYFESGERVLHRLTFLYYSSIFFLKLRIVYGERFRHMNHYIFKKQNNVKNSEAYHLLQSGDGALMLKKLYCLFPVMLLNRISIMLMLSVDSIVVGWGIGEKAVASVNYLQPFNFVMGAITPLIGSGIATLMSKQLGANDPTGMERKKKAILYSTLLLSVISSIIQLPICFIMFGLYDMDSAVHNMALRYAYAAMICTPFDIMNTIGTYLLTSIGRAKTVLIASIIQSGVNVILDLFFVFGFGMSTDGAGFGTLIATIAYWGYIMNYLLRHSEFLKIDRSVECLREMFDIVRYGIPTMISMLADAIFGTVLFWFISKRLSDAGIAIHSVCLFAASFVTIIRLSMRFAMQPITGMLSTIGDAEGMHRLMKQAMFISLILCGSIMLTAEFFPDIFFRAYGYREIPAIGIYALRAYALHFLLMGINNLLQLYFNSWNDVKFASIQGSFNSIILPAAFSSIFFLFGAPWTLWLSYVIADVICFAVSYRRYLWKYQSKRTHTAPNEFNVVTHPDEAPQAAAQLEDVLLENGISRSLANRVAICVEEIGAYAVPAKQNARVTIQLYACISEGEASIIMLDDGQCVAFPETDRESFLATSNYEMLKRVASKTAYDYVLDLNRFTVKLHSRTSERNNLGKLYEGDIVSK